MSVEILLLFNIFVFVLKPIFKLYSNSNSMASMGSFGIPPNRTYGSQGTINSFHSVFGGSGGGGDTSTPPLLDLSEFPSLNRGQGDTMPQPNPPMPGKQPYGE